MSQRKLRVWTLASTLVLAASAAVADPKPLNRSLFLPVEFVLCEHLEKAVFFQDDQPVSLMPARRVFQFTYYPSLERMLPEIVQLRVEGQYLAGGEEFVARLALTPGGIHTAHGTKGLDTLESMKKQRHKIDVRLEPRRIELHCQRFCAKAPAAATAPAGGWAQ